MSAKKSPVHINRMKEAIDKIGKTNNDVANILKCDRTTVNKWYNGELTPSVDKLINICKTSGVSADYLLGLTDVAMPLNTDDAVNLRTACDYTGLSEENAELLFEVKGKPSQKFINRLLKLFDDWEFRDAVNEYEIPESPYMKYTNYVLFTAFNDFLNKGRE